MHALRGCVKRAWPSGLSRPKMATAQSSRPVFTRILPVSIGEPRKLSKPNRSRAAAARRGPPPARAHRRRRSLHRGHAGRKVENWPFDGASCPNLQRRSAQRLGRDIRTCGSMARQCSAHAPLVDVDPQWASWCARWRSSSTLAEQTVQVFTTARSEPDTGWCIRHP
jgi:hypothetical protein